MSFQTAAQNAILEAATFPDTRKHPLLVPDTVEVGISQIAAAARRQVHAGDDKRRPFRKIWPKNLVSDVTVKTREFHDGVELRKHIEMQYSGQIQPPPRKVRQRGKVVRAAAVEVVAGGGGEEQCEDGEEHGVLPAVDEEEEHDVRSSSSSASSAARDPRAEDDPDRLNTYQEQTSSHTLTPRELNVGAGRAFTPPVSPSGAVQLADHLLPLLGGQNLLKDLIALYNAYQTLFTEKEELPTLSGRLNNVAGLYVQHIAQRGVEGRLRGRGMTRAGEWGSRESGGGKGSRESGGGRDGGGDHVKRVGRGRVCKTKEYEFLYKGSD